MNAKSIVLAAAKETAAKMILAYGWTEAHKHAATEAAPHSPTGNIDGFWTAVLAAIEKENA